MECIINPISQSTTYAERKRQSSNSDRSSNAPVANQEANIRLETDEKQVQDQTEVGDVVEVRNRGFREECGLEAWNTSEDRRTKNDAPDDFGDDAWLADLGKRPVEKVTYYDDEASLSEGESNNASARDSRLETESDMNTMQYSCLPV